MARRSKSSIEDVWPRNAALAKSVPRGSVMVGTRTLPLTLGGSSKSFQPAHAGFAKAFGIGHDVRLRHRHEILGAEELADLVADVAKLAEQPGQTCRPGYLALRRSIVIMSFGRRTGIAHSLAPFDQFSRPEIRRKRGRSKQLGAHPAVRDCRGKLRYVRFVRFRRQGFQPYWQAAWPEQTTPTMPWSRSRCSPTRQS